LIKLSRLEEEVVGDLAQADHALWEVFGFVRFHSLGLNETEVFQTGRDLIASWSDRGWLESVDSSGAPAGVPSLVALVDQLGRQALEPFASAPWLRLSKVGRDAMIGFARLPNLRVQRTRVARFARPGSPLTRNPLGGVWAQGGGSNHGR
jgi:hypothetical protein